MFPSPEPHLLDELERRLDAVAANVSSAAASARAPALGALLTAAGPAGSLAERADMLGAETRRVSVASAEITTLYELIESLAQDMSQARLGKH